MGYRLSGKALAFIRSERVARVATVDKKGVPHNVPVCAVASSGVIYFASEKDARKVRNLRSNPRVAVAFDRYRDDWKRLAGVMVLGSCTIIDHGAEFRRARQALYRKYRLYARVARINEGESVIIGVTPTGSFSWGL
jgi:nitroimidazol reductase NimA-like FMN-containing flavoprotein (pyridoxamine 5'-phosphate oxidase superfamily)